MRRTGSSCVLWDVVRVHLDSSRPSLVWGVHTTVTVDDWSPRRLGPLHGLHGTLVGLVWTPCRCTGAFHRPSHFNWTKWTNRPFVQLDPSLNACYVPVAGRP